MNQTIYDTPIFNTVMHYLARFLLFITGWRTEGKPPEFKKYILIAAPHTSNWDFVYTLLVAFSLKIKVYAMAKNELFRPPFGPIMRWLGMLPVVRSRSTNMVASTVETFRRYDELVVAVPPSGTRKKVMVWKSGFYHIANGAGIPIVLGYIDYRRKAGGLGPCMIPTGNIEKDMVFIRKFYATITAKYPEKAVGSATVKRC